MIGANAPVNLYILPLYLNTNPSLGTIALEPPIASNFSICNFNFFSFSTLSGFCKSFNAKTQDKAGDVIPVEITVYADRSFSFITKSPPAARLILKSANIEKGSSEPNKEKVGAISDSDLEKIASIKMDDLNANSLEQAKEMIRGTARSMGIEVKG